MEITDNSIERLGVMDKRTIEYLIFVFSSAFILMILLIMTTFMEI